MVRMHIYPNEGTLKDVTSGRGTFEPSGATSFISESGSE